jgi:hypothetical protein
MVVISNTYKLISSLLCAVFCLTALVGCSSDTQAVKLDQVQTGPYNLGFEENSLDGRTTGKNWFGPLKEYVPHYEIKIGSEGPYEGKQYAIIYSTGKPDGREFGNIMQSIDATPYRGKTIRFRAAVRIASESDGRAQMWMRVDRKDMSMGFFDNMSDRPITSSEWKEYDIVGTIDTKADQIYFGCMLVGEGKVNFDAVKIDIVDNDPPIETLDPYRIGWIRAGSHPDEYLMGFTPEKEAIAKIEYNAKSEPSGFGTFMQMYPPGKWLGKRLKMTGMIRTENVENWCGMWCRIDGQNEGETYDFDNMNDRPITGTTDWKKYEIIVNIPAKASAIAYGVLVGGRGTAYFKDISFEEIGNALEE